MVRDGQKNCGTILCHKQMKLHSIEEELWAHSIEEVALELSPQSRKIGCQL